MLLFRDVEPGGDDGGSFGRFIGGRVGELLKWQLRKRKVKEIKSEFCMKFRILLLSLIEIIKSRGHMVTVPPLIRRGSNDSGLCVNLCKNTKRRD